MNKLSNPHRRTLLKSLMYGALAASVVTVESNAAEAPLVTADDPTAKAMHYVPDAKLSKTAKPGGRCGTCALYTGDRKAAQGTCSIFPGKQVKTTGWCEAWSTM